MFLPYRPAMTASFLFTRVGVFSPFPSYLVPLWLQTSLISSDPSPDMFYGSDASTLHTGIISHHLSYSAVQI